MDLWACPVCLAPLERLANGSITEYLNCAGCAVRYPVCTVGDQAIPWLFTDPGGAAADWQARYQGFLLQNLAQQQRLQAALCETGLTVLNRERLERQLHARELQSQQITDLLMPLGFSAEPEVPAVDLNRLGGSIDKNQGLLSYHNNVFRDWAWNNGENEAQYAALEATYLPGESQDLGRLLVLGAGAGRLAFDIHQTGRSTTTTLLDYNPLLLMVASHLFSGAGIELYEFPVAPLTSRSHAVLQRCCRPKVEPSIDTSGVRFAFADATKAPFAQASFDTVLTPWLLDILPCGLADFLPQINRLLPIGGIWQNTGSLAFAHANQRWCYSEEETLELIEQQGFEVIQSTRTVIPYLQSPHSSHRRTESVLSFRARKNVEHPVRSVTAYVPDWALQLELPVPSTSPIAMAAAHHLLIAQVLAAIDGQRSVDEISQLIAKKYELSKKSAEFAVRQILLAAD